MTGQEEFVRYELVNVAFAVGLVNELATGHAFGRSLPPIDEFAAVRRILEDVDPSSAASLRAQDVPGVVALAAELRRVFDALATGDLDAAAGRLNELLATHPAHPHLAKDDGHWRLHHHPVDAELVPYTTAVCAEGLARVVGDGHAARLGTCASEGCERVFHDESKNGSRRFCSTTCQNRVKAAAFRHRRATG